MWISTRRYIHWIAFTISNSNWMRAWRCPEKYHCRQTKVLFTFRSGFMYPGGLPNILNLFPSKHMKNMEALHLHPCCWSTGFFLFALCLHANCQSTQSYETSRKSCWQTKPGVQLCNTLLSGQKLKQWLNRLSECSVLASLLFQFEYFDPSTVDSRYLRHHGNNNNDDKNNKKWYQEPCSGAVDVSHYSSARVCLVQQCLKGHSVGVEQHLWSRSSS